MYEISYTSSAARYFKKIKDKHLLSAFKDVIASLKNGPYIGEQKTGDLHGIWGIDVKYANSNYEIAYRIYDGSEKFVVIILAGTRENFYEELKRLVK